ncbi:MAG: TetR/AcrR family transcriptional regulator [Oscillospiraceae bacterium]|nr:TetR/AcrR family transcriptional regulator [Oscillospiraceae bacterium]
MDLRQKKTLHAITQAFYALRKQKRLESITVTELCKHAQISKATFYLHYRDIFDLSDTLQHELIASVFSQIHDPMQILTDSAAFLHACVHAVEQESEKINILFSDTQAGTLPLHILQYLKEHIYANAPQLQKDPKIQVLLTYHVMGSYYACMENPNQIGYKQVLKILETLPPFPVQ